MKFKCENCGNEVKFGEGRISLVCQHCGCFHLKFDTALLASPVLPSEEIGLTTLIEKDESFFGSHGNSAVWEVRLPVVEPVVIEPVVVEKKAPPPLYTPAEEKAKEDLEEAKKLKVKEGVEKKEEEKKPKKPTLLKTVRKLRSGLGK